VPEDVPSVEVAWVRHSRKSVEVREVCLRELRVYSLWYEGVLR
jgi:hypothetical protein